MKDKYFLDTNIFIYSFESDLTDRKNISDKLIKTALTGKGCISFQIIQEFINVAGKKFENPINPNDLKIYIEKVLYPVCEVFPSKELYFSALDIQKRWQFSFYDSLVIAAAQEANCNILYSEDLQHQQKINNLTIVNPYISD